MADSDIESFVGFVDKRYTQGSQTRNLSGGNGAANSAAAVAGNYLTVNGLRARLAVASAYYTSSILNSMTRNDMVYALRTIDDAAGI